MRRYLRFASVGDSTTVGLGDVHPPGTPTAGTWRGWSRLLAAGLRAGHEVSYLNLAVSGATTLDVWEQQVPHAVAHRPDIASLVVGVNDTFKSGWDPVRVHEHVLASAAALHAAGALLLTVRFHDHGAVFHLPGPLRRALWARLDVLNAAYAEVQAVHGGIQVDLAAHPGIRDRTAWYVDRLHPSELGHRALATAFAEGLTAAGYPCLPPSTVLDGPGSDVLRDLWWALREGAPWVGRRARDLGPWAVRLAWSELAVGRSGAAASR